MVIDLHGKLGSRAASPARCPVAVGLGSNQGDRLGHLRTGWRGLKRFLEEVRVSAVYETSPLHVENQPLFLNACAVGYTRLTSRQLLANLRDLERAALRVRGERFGPRTLDLDLLLFGEEQIHTPELTVPHPGLRERAFVLVPLAEVAADWVVPGDVEASPTTVAELAKGIGRQGVWDTDLRL